MKRARRQPSRPLGECYYCEERAYSVDHYIPVSRGGTSEPRNLVPACLQCNEVKADMLPEEFFWHCKLLLEEDGPRNRKFLQKARKVLSLLAPVLLEQVNA